MNQNLDTVNEHEGLLLRNPSFYRLKMVCWNSSPSAVLTYRPCIAAVAKPTTSLNFTLLVRTNGERGSHFSVDAHDPVGFDRALLRNDGLAG